MNLSNKIKEVKEKIKPLENEIFLVLVVIFSAFIVFGLIKLYEIRKEKTPIIIENISENNPGGNPGAAMGEVNGFVAGNEAKLFVASKNGAKYYYPWCSGAGRIKEENKIWFSSANEAQQAGFAPAANCKGL